MAAGAGGAGLHRAVCPHEPAQPLAQGAGADLGRRVVADRPVDVGRRSRPALCLAGALGRIAGHIGARDLRSRLRLSLGHSRRARPPLQITGDPFAVRALCRIDPRRAADQPAVHGERDVSAVHARRLQHRQAAARPDRDHPVCRRLSCRSRPRRPAGGAARPARGRRGARPVLLAQELADRAAAGDPPCHPAAGQHLHRLLQGHQPGADHRPVRPLDDRQDRDHRSGLAALQRRDLSLRGAIYFMFCFSMSRYSRQLEQSRTAK